MTRKSRAAPPTIAQMTKLEAAMKVKRDAYYAADERYSEYRGRVKELGVGYTEVIDGVMYVITITPEQARVGTQMTIIECKRS